MRGKLATLRWRLAKPKIALPAWPAIALPRPSRTFKVTAVLAFAVLLAAVAVAAALLAEPVFAVGRDGLRNDFPPLGASAPGQSGLLHRLASDLVGSSGQARYRALVVEFDHSIPLPKGTLSAARRQKALTSLSAAADDRHLPANERSQLADDWGLEEIMLLAIAPQNQQSSIIETAAKALELAVALDGDNETAKFNLELLWRLSRPQKQQSQQSQPQGGKPRNTKQADRGKQVGSNPKGYSW